MRSRWLVAACLLAHADAFALKRKGIAAKPKKKKVKKAPPSPRPVTEALPTPAEAQLARVAAAAKRCGPDIRRALAAEGYFSTENFLDAAAVAAMAREARTLDATLVPSQSTRWDGKETVARGRRADDARWACLCFKKDGACVRTRVSPWPPRSRRNRGRAWPPRSRRDRGRASRRRRRGAAATGDARLAVAVASPNSRSRRYDKEGVRSTQILGGADYEKAPRLTEYVVALTSALAAEATARPLSQSKQTNKLAVCDAPGAAYPKHIDNGGGDDRRLLTAILYPRPRRNLLSRTTRRRGRSFAAASDPPPRTIRVVAAARPRPASADYPCRRRGDPPPRKASAD